jgi:hypothetical protein
MARFVHKIVKDDQTYRVTCGVDHALGFFCTVLAKRGRVADYPDLTAGPGDLNGVMRALVDAGVFEEWEVFDAWQQAQVVDDVDEIEDESTRALAQIIVELKDAARD